MPIDLALVDEAEHRGYLSFNKERTTITYLCGKTRTEDYLDPEEPVRAWVYAWLILDRGYPANRIETEYVVPRRTPNDWADIIVFADDKRTDPYIVVEVKEENCSAAEWRQAVEQGF